MGHITCTTSLTRTIVTTQNYETNKLLRPSRKHYVLNPKESVKSSKNLYF